MNKKTNIIIGGLLVSLGIILGVLATILSDNMIGQEATTTIVTTNAREETIEDYLSELIRENSYYYQNDALVIEGALSGMVESLEDPYSTYFSEADYKEYSNRLNEMVYGVGISVTINGAYPLILNVINGSPAFEAGLQKGQTIKTVDGIDIKNKTITETADLIKGAKGTKRILGIYTDNPDVVTTINVTTDLVTSETIDYNFEIVGGHRIGYLMIDSFMRPTYEEFLAAMTHLENKNIDELIIDVRNNPGGLLTSVKDILDYFINTEQAFMYSESKEKEKKAYYINENDYEINYNIVVLMNENSASASEIFAATMYEIGNYQLIGKTTFGKGTMQNTYPLNKEGTKVVKLTTNIWLTPNEEWIHHIGVSPTIEVNQTNFEGISYIDSSLKIGFDHVNEEIKDVQTFLNRKGYTTRMDGYFDVVTQNAVLAYQASNGLNQTGIVDYKTAYQINLDIMNYLNEKENDVQYQEALTYLLSH